MSKEWLATKLPWLLDEGIEIPVPRIRKLYSVKPYVDGWSGYTIYPLYVYGRYIHPRTKRLFTYGVNFCTQFHGLQDIDNTDRDAILFDAFSQAYIMGYKDGYKRANRKSNQPEKQNPTQQEVG